MRKNYFFRFLSLLMLISLSSAVSFAQETLIKGRVVDTQGEPLIGVSIVEKGTTNGSSTDIDGAFSLRVELGTDLQFSYIGFQEINMPAENEMHVVMNAIVQAMDEVVVVGYGVQKKANLTGAVASVGSDKVVKGRQANVTNSLIGQVPGIIAKQASGEPGADGANIQIRGLATFTGSTSPTYIIDGIERKEADFARINPADIESINVLKDAASAAVFGMRGANGVILVTTKRGSKGKTSINYSTTVSIQTPTSLPKFADSYDFARLTNVYMGDEIYTDQELQMFKDGSNPDKYPNTDWYGLMLSKNALQHQHDISFSGGTEKVDYFVSGGYINQDGLWDGLGYERFSLRANIDAKISKTTNLSVDISGRKEEVNGTKRNSSSVFQELVRNTPVLPAIYENGLYAVPDATHPNIIADEDNGYSRSRKFNVQSRVELSQKLDFITKGLEAKALVAYDFDYIADKHWATASYIYQKTDDDKYELQDRGSASLSQADTDTENIETQIQINYNQNFGKDDAHSVSALAMFLTHQASYHNLWVSRSSFDSDVMDQINAGNEDGQTLGGYDSKNARLSFVGRVNYAYQNRYMFEANVRRDASENFAPDYRWGTFASVSAAWIISEEKFFESLLDKINYLKIRGSIGTLGNDNTGGIAFPYYSRFDLYGGGGNAGNNLPNNLGDYIFGDYIIKGLMPGAIANKLATWETSVKRNVAIDFGLFNMFNISVDLFNETRKNILAQRNAQIPGSFGASLPLENIGEVKNGGVDASMNFSYKFNNDLRLSLGGNFTYAKNEIVDMAEAEGVSDLLRRTGRPINGYYGYKNDGIFQSQTEIDNYAKQQVAGENYATQPGDIKYVDVTGDGVVNAEDRTYLGAGNMPEITYGFNLGLDYKGFDLSAVFQGAGKTQVYLTGGIIQPFYNSGNLPQMWVDGAWSEDNMTTSLPRLAVSTHNFPTSDCVETYLYDASYLRLKVLELGYTFPSRWMNKAKINTLRIYASANNLFTITDVPQIDPENTSSIGWNYPQMKGFNFGISLKF